MPEPDDINKGGAGDDAAAVAAAEKVAADAAAAAAATGNGSGDGQETVASLKEKLKKTEEDRDNYKTGLLSKKADERNLGGDDKGGGDKGGNVIDEKKITDTATAAVTKTLRDAGEKVAKREFLSAHQEYIDDSQWASLLSHLTFKGGETTKEEIRDRMEAAVLEHKRSTGKLEEYLKEEHARGVREGRIQEQTGSGAGTGGAGDKNDVGKTGELSAKGQEMARAMHNDPEKVRKVDLSRDNVIDVLATGK